MHYGMQFIAKVNVLYSDVCLINVLCLVVCILMYLCLVCIHVNVL